MQNSQKDFYKKFLGSKGESIAVRYLKKHGYKVLKKNFVTPFGEADIVCQKDGNTVFVEVKTRSSLDYGIPSQAVNYKKQEKYRKIAEWYLLKHADENIGFAVVEVYEDKVNLIENAF